MPESPDKKRVQRLRARDGGSGANSSDGSNLEVAALGYEAGEDHAPKVLARGRGHMARKILELAEQHDLPVTKDPTLVSILGALDVGAEIPPDLYGVIAEVLAWAYHADKAAGDQRRSRAA